MATLRCAGIFIVFASLFSASGAFAGAVEIVTSAITCQNRVCDVDVTLEHADTGWDHYADHWRVLDADHNEIGRRTLYHPHVNEQPFKRGLNQLRLPPNTERVWIQAHDNVHGYSDTLYELTPR